MRLTIMETCSRCCPPPAWSHAACGRADVPTSLVGALHDGARLAGHRAAADRQRSGGCQRDQALAAALPLSFQPKSQASITQKLVHTWWLSMMLQQLVVLHSADHLRESADLCLSLYSSWLTWQGFRGLWTVPWSLLGFHGRHSLRMPLFQAQQESLTEPFVKFQAGLQVGSCHAPSAYTFSLQVCQGDVLVWSACTRQCQILSELKSRSRHCGPLNSQYSRIGRCDAAHRPCPSEWRASRELGTVHHVKAGGLASRVVQCIASCAGAGKWRDTAARAEGQGHRRASSGLDAATAVPGALSPTLES